MNKSTKTVMKLQALGMAVDAKDEGSVLDQAKEFYEWLMEDIDMDDNSSVTEFQPRLV